MPLASSPIGFAAGLAPVPRLGIMQEAVLAVNDLARSGPCWDTSRMARQRDPHLDDRPKNPHAVALGRMGGKKGGPKGGKARWKGVSADERRAHARKAAAAR